MLRALARRLLARAGAARGRRHRPPALHRRLGRGRRRLLRRRQRDLRRGEPRRPRRAALQPGGDARLALQPRGAARPPARLRAGAVRLAEGRLRRARGLFAATGPMTDLRSVMSLYPEALTILARPGAGIARLADLAGKRVDIGPPASGRRATVMRILTGARPRPRRLRRAARAARPAARSTSSAPAGSTPTILIVGHPNAAVARALQRLRRHPRAGQGPQVDAGAREAAPTTCRVVIPQSTYPELAADVPTYAVIATVVTRADIAPDIVEALVTRDARRPAADRHARTRPRRPRP